MSFFFFIYLFSICCAFQYQNRTIHSIHILDPNHHWNTDTQREWEEKKARQEKKKEIGSNGLAYTTRRKVFLELIVGLSTRVVFKVLLLYSALLWPFIFFLLFNFGYEIRFIWFDFACYLCYFVYVFDETLFFFVFGVFICCKFGYILNQTYLPSVSSIIVRKA